jgi:predicted TIM-barrel fold metal-dependent hydrolase
MMMYEGQIIDTHMHLWDTVNGHAWLPSFAKGSARQSQLEASKAGVPHDEGHSRRLLSKSQRIDMTKSQPAVCHLFPPSG